MPNLYPASVPFPDLLDGAVIDAQEHDSNYNALVVYANGLSTGDNINAGVITGAQIVNSAVLTTPVIGTATGTALTLSGALAAGSAVITTTITAASSTLSGALTAGSAVISGGIAVTGNVVYNIATNAQAASYTLVLTDTGKVVELALAGANTLTVPPNSAVAFAIGTQITILQTGAGQTTITAGAGVTINGTPGLKLRVQWSSATLLKRATNTWVALRRFEQLSYASFYRKRCIGG